MNIITYPEDKFTSLDEVKHNFTEGTDYRIELFDRQCEATVIAPHGGFIEAGTSAIAAALAKKSFNLFDFQALIPDHGSSVHMMHVTSTRFRDAALTRLLKSSSFALSVHAMEDEDHAEIWLGGLNAPFKQLVYSNLREAHFKVNLDSPRYRGESENNVVNLPSLKGVQIEISHKLRKQMFDGRIYFATDRECSSPTPRFYSFVRVVRRAMNTYLSQISA
jgi:phage replication-related protein YjqB (UPF0714/DUF867 family)